MERYATVLGAFDAGKLPTTKQINGSLDWLLQGPLIQVESTDATGTLSERGKEVAGALRELIDAYKRLGSSKNGDDVIQDAIWNLSQGDLSNVQAKLTTEAVDGSTKDEALTDAQRLASSIRSLLNVFMSFASSEGSSLFSDFASFARLALANSAETIEQNARAAKESLRDVDKEVQDGKRDDLGRKRKSDDDQTDDPRAKFERSMDSARDAGSSLIGGVQSAKATVEDVSNKSSNRLQQSLDKVLQRAQRDKNYHEAVSTIFDLIQKWSEKTIDAANAAQFITLDSFIDDPTGRVPEAIRQLRGVAERFAGGKSLDDLFVAINRCGMDIKDDQELRQFLDDYLKHARKSLHNPPHTKTDEFQKDSDELSKRWEGLMSQDSEQRHKWSKDLAVVNKEVTEYFDRFNADEDIVRLRQAHSKLNDKISVAAGSLASSDPMGQYAWIWQDILNAYVPRVLGMIKSVPIPRIEYKDPETEFVIENLDISSLQLLPGHAHFKTTTEFDISQKEASAEAKTNFATRTNVRFQGLQITLREVSFYYKDKTSGLGPDTFTGLLDMHLPEKGIDVDLTLTMIPTADSQKRERLKRFHTLDKVAVSFHDGMDVNISESNHPILVTAFKPMFRNRFRETLETALREQITFAVNSLDHMAFDVHKRAEVFSDASAPPSVAYMGGFWSKIGAIRKQPGGIFEGISATGAGFIKDDPNDNMQFAMGTAPQILAGSKRGPISPFTGDNAMSVDDVKDVVEGAQVATKETLQAAKDTLYTFKREVEMKRDAELKREGWRSPAFDALTGGKA